MNRKEQIREILFILSFFRVVFHTAKIKIKKQLRKIVTAFLLWCHQESNRGHKDFQSFALPTELWHHHFLIADAKVEFIFDIAKYFRKKMLLFFLQGVPSLCFQLKFLSVTGDESTSQFRFGDVSDDFHAFHGCYFIMVGQRDGEQ